MGLGMGKTGKKDLNFELNLLPVFDILSVCICFLLMTVVWVQVSTLKTAQAVGGQPQAEAKNTPSVWVTINGKNDLEINFKNAPSKVSDRVIKSRADSIDWAAFEAAVSSVGPKFEMALIMPAKNSSYADIIRIMDSFKRANIKDVGLSPL